MNENKFLIEIDRVIYIRFRIKNEIEDLLKLYLKDFEIIIIISILQILIN